MSRRVVTGPPWRWLAPTGLAATDFGSYGLLISGAGRVTQGGAPNPTPNPVPEPATWAILLGIPGLIGASRRRNRARAG